MRFGVVCLLVEREYKAGDPSPAGYLEWHAWAKVQYAAGFRQYRCPTCHKYRFAHETCCPSAPAGHPEPL